MLAVHEGAWPRLQPLGAEMPLRGKLLPFTMQASLLDAGDRAGDTSLNPPAAGLSCPETLTLCKSG